MIIEKGYSSHYLYIDLSSRSWEVKRITRQTEKEYIGGRGIGLRLLADHAEDLQRIDPLGPENPLLCICSPFLATGAPCSSQFEILSKSPLTGLSAHEGCCGPFGEACRTAGWDGVVITGIADAPVAVIIHYEGVEFKQAGSMWGMTSSETRKQLHLGARDGELVIGPAGEHLVKYANVQSGNSSFGRGGIGAVMGSKNLKAVVAHGKSYTFKPVFPKRFEHEKRRMRSSVERSEYAHACRDYGSNMHIQPGIELGYLPGRNFTRTTDEAAMTLTGEQLAGRYMQRFSSCPHCLVLCGHKGLYPDRILRTIPGFTITGMFGPNIGNYNPDVIGQWQDMLYELGLDPVSTGGVLAWAMEAHEKGVINEQIRFSDPEHVEGLLRMIAYREGFGDELAQGTKILSAHYGSPETAVQVKGLESVPVHPDTSLAQGLAFAVGDHTNIIMFYLERVLGLVRAQSHRQSAYWVLFFERVLALTSSLQICGHLVIPLLFESGFAGRLPKTLLRFMMNWTPRLAGFLLIRNLPSELYRSITGYHLSGKQLFEAGRRIHALGRQLDAKMGMTDEDEVISQKFSSAEEIRQMRDIFYQLAKD
jgi:aldehyde:ferredoxin oxidoreductase